MLWEPSGGVCGSWGAWFFGGWGSGDKVRRLLNCILKGELGFPRQKKMGKDGLRQMNGNSWDGLWKLWGLRVMSLQRGTGTKY